MLRSWYVQTPWIAFWPCASSPWFSSIFTAPNEDIHKPSAAVGSIACACGGLIALGS
ncbi:MAG: hypothetical protein R3B48_08685 [Kofleriaceae bacterium]